ncbi:DsbA family protein [Caulobacter sp. S45]|uniref:DsbA family protein n=1 Tax=Caulobacter sp. S45 TaxID=1641861 RepID=UPI00131BB3BD|nr:DsbA family protein [Caulobacter sp. S45]
MSVSILNRRTAVLGLMAPALLAGCGSHGASYAALMPEDMTQGDPNAKVTVVEYASVACPICGRWFREVYPDFKAKYIDTGKVHFVYREMLVGNSDEVTVAASGFLLARCAGKDKYFSVVDAIYRSQPGLFDQPRQVLLNIAASAGFNQAQFDACVKNDAALQALAKRVDANSKRDNVNATPTFVINGKVLQAGYQPLTTLDAEIAKAMAAVK